MTYDEALICQKYRYPVIVNSKNIEYLKGHHTISSVEKSMCRHDRDYRFYAGITCNGRVVYHLELSDIEIDSQLRGVLDTKLKEQNKQRLKACLKILISDGGNKTTITKLVKQLIDEIKTK